MNATEMDIEDKWMEMYESSVKYAHLKLRFTFVVLRIILRSGWTPKIILKGRNSGEIVFYLSTDEGFISSYKLWRKRKSRKFLLKSNRCENWIKLELDLRVLCACPLLKLLRLFANELDNFLEHFTINLECLSVL